MLTNQNQIRILIHKLTIILCILIEYIYNRTNENTVHGPWGTLIKYKCQASTQYRLANALVEEVEGRLNNFKVGKKIRHLVIFGFNFSLCMRFVNICEIFYAL